MKMTALQKSKSLVKKYGKEVAVFICDEIIAEVKQIHEDAKVRGFIKFELDKSGLIHWWEDVKFIINE